jgi:hypothetical protein
MSKFFGVIGYAISDESAPGVWYDKIIERSHYGDVNRSKSQYEASSSLNDNLNISNEFSIIADPFAYENFQNMKYITFMGAKWKITSVEVQYPRLILTVGGVYNEQTT